jgi:hypothetical protein
LIAYTGCFALSPGDLRSPVYTDGTNVLSNPIIFSNQFVMVPAPTVSNHVVRLMDITNIASANSITNVISVGSGTSLVFGVSSGVAKIPSLIPGANITLTVGNAGSNITIASTASGGGGDWFSTSNNVQNSGTTNTFNGRDVFNGTVLFTNRAVFGKIASTFSNIDVRGGAWYDPINWDSSGRVFYDENGVAFMDYNSGGRAIYADDASVILDTRVGSRSINNSSGPIINIDNSNLLGAWVFNDGFSTPAGTTATINGALFSSNNTFVTAKVNAGFVTNIVNAGTGSNLVSLASQVATFRTLVPGSNISFTDTGTNFTISSSGGSADAFMVTTTNSNAFVAGKTQTVNGTLFASNFFGIGGSFGGTNTGVINIANNISSLSRQLSSGSFVTMDYGLGIGYDDQGESSVSWIDRKLINAAGAVVVNYSNSVFSGNWTFNGSPTVNAAQTLTVNGTTITSNLTVYSSFNASGATNLTSTAINGVIPMANMDSTLLTNVAVNVGSGSSPIVSVGTRVATLKTFIAGTNMNILSTSTSLTINAGTDIRSVGITVDGGGSAITSGTKGYIAVPYTGIIRSWTIIGDQSGSIVFNVYKTNSQVPMVLPTSTTAITDSMLPTVASAVGSNSVVLTSWITNVVTGDIIGFNVTNNATSFTRATLQLGIERTGP